MEGKLPPQATEIEQAVLGALLLDKQALDKISPILTSTMFYIEAHATIYKAIIDLNFKRSPIDLITVTNELRSSGYLNLVGGVMGVVKLTERLTSAGNIESHAHIVKERYLKREIIAIGQRIAQQGYNDSTDVFELKDEAEKRIFELFSRMGDKQAQHIADLYKSQIKRIEAHKECEWLGYRTGLRELDFILQGLKKQELMIIGARPAMGKTSLALSFAKNLATTQNIGVAIFSLEMSAEALCSRFTSLNSSIPLTYIINSNVRGVMFEKMMNDLPAVNNTPLVIDDEGGITITQLRSKLRTILSTQKVEVVIVDYLQKMRAENAHGRTRENEINQIVSGLKNVAKEFNVPLIALCQLSRDLEKRMDKRPLLSDLRESGAIEQEADVVAFLYRPDEGSQGSVGMVEGQTEIIISKNRNGALGVANCVFKKEFTLYEDLPSSYEYGIYTGNNKELGMEEKLF